MFTAPHFQDHDEARKYLEALRWAGEPVCAHCGTVGGHYASKKPGVWRCHSKECRKDFSVTTKTVMESSHIKLNIWLQAYSLMTASKKGFSAHQLHRSLKVTYKTAWFLAHRIRESMRTGGLAPMGGAGKIVEADETYFGEIPEASQKPSPQRQGRPYKGGKRKGVGTKRAILSLVERGGRVRSFHVPTADQETVERIVKENIAKETKIHTDESKLYWNVADHFAGHETVNHSAKEYVRYNHTFPDGKLHTEKVHTNSAEGFFGNFKRGMKGVYQHCSEKHLHRYLAEFDFRYNNRSAFGISDGERAELALKAIAGKRLTYRLPH